MLLKKNKKNEKKLRIITVVEQKDKKKRKKLRKVTVVQHKRKLQKESELDFVAEHGSLLSEELDDWNGIHKCWSFCAELLDVTYTDNRGNTKGIRTCSRVVNQR